MIDDDVKPLGCADLAAAGRWARDDCCRDCHGHRGKCGDLTAVVLPTPESIEMEVCCAALETVSPGASRFALVERQVA